MTWFRVDNRLVHGQVIEGWLPYVAARHLVVANDAMAQDDLRQQITLLAIPQSVETHFVMLEALADTLRSCDDDALVLFEDCKDARQASDAGVAMKSLNIGNLHYGPGKKTTSATCRCLGTGQRRPAYPAGPPRPAGFSLRTVREGEGLH